MDKKIFSRIYLGVAVFFSLLYIFIAQFMSNVTGKTKVIMAIVAILFDLLLYVMSYLYSNWKITMEDGEIRYRTLLRKEKRISYSDISRAVKDEYGNLILYNEDKVFIKLSTLDGYAMLEENLRAHRIKIKNASDITNFTMRSTKLYYGVDIFSTIISIVFVVACLHYKIGFGLLFFLVLFAASIFDFLGRCFNKTVIHGSVITCYRFLRKPKIMKFSDVECIKRKEIDNAEYIYLYSADGSKIKISKLHKNAELFEEVIKRQKWRRSK